MSQKKRKKGAVSTSFIVDIPGQMDLFDDTIANKPVEESVFGEVHAGWFFHLQQPMLEARVR